MARNRTEHESQLVTWSSLTHDRDALVTGLADGRHYTVSHHGHVVGTLLPRSPERRPVVVGVCGASGVGYAAALIWGLLAAGEAVDLIVSRAGRLTILDETGVAFREASWESDLQAWCAACGFEVDLAEADIRCWPASDFTAGPSSGSYRTRAMVVVPATTAAVGGIANGLSKDLLQRAAEVTLKERRPLLVVPRETPLTRSTLQHLLALDEMGAVVLPASPGFYAGATDIRQVYGFVAGKALDLLDVPHDLFRRWDGDLGGARRATPTTSPGSDT